VSATRTVYKYALAGGMGAPIDVFMPEGAEVLSAGSQTGDDIHVWAKVDPVSPSEKRRLYVVGTGHHLPENVGRFVGTVLLCDGRIVAHVFDAGRAT
jgi:hypothetical protein